MLQVALRTQEAQGVRLDKPHALGPALACQGIHDGGKSTVRMSHDMGGRADPVDDSIDEVDLLRHAGVAVRPCVGRRSVAQQAGRDRAVAVTQMPQNGLPARARSETPGKKQDGGPNTSLDIVKRKGLIAHDNLLMARTSCCAA